MTVAVVVKVFDGLVLAADSATTFTLDDGSSQVYNNANKIFHLHRHLPIGAMTWGLGNIGDASIATIAKDLRRRLMGRDPSYTDWQLDLDDYTVEAVAGRVVEMLYDELWRGEYPDPGKQPGGLGFLIAGYSAPAKQPEVWVVYITDVTERPKPNLLAPFDTSGILTFAQPEATLRLFNGFDPSLLGALEAVLPPDEFAKVKPVMMALKKHPAEPAMPFADAIRLARFLVDVTIGYSRYLLGPDTVGGPVEVAGINRHEGFKWISRKHYYSTDLNPEEPGHAY